MGMFEKTHLNRAIAQLALDYNCEESSLRGLNSVSSVTRRAHLPGRRMGDFEDSPLMAMSMPGHAVITCTEELEEDMLHTANRIDPEWLFEAESLNAVSDILKKHSLYICDIHEYWLPARRLVQKTVPDYEIVFYDRESIMQFEEDDRFGEAYLFDERRPDIIGVAAVENGEILGMAGASADSEILYQIGVNVNRGYRGRGIATTLVTLIANAVLDMGKTPLYGMVTSHLVSKRVAWDAGFKPAWTEFFTDRTE